MTIASKLFKLEASIPALSYIADMKLPALAAWHIAKLCKAVNAELVELNERRNALIKELGKPNEKGESVIEPGTPERAAFDEQIKPLLEADIELNVKPLTPALFGKAELPAAVMLQLEDFFADEEAQHE